MANFLATDYGITQLFFETLYLIDTHSGTIAEAICDPRIIFRALFVMSFKRYSEVAIWEDRANEN